MLSHTHMMGTIQDVQMPELFSNYSDSLELFSNYSEDSLEYCLHNSGENICVPSSCRKQMKKVNICSILLSKERMPIRW